MRTCLEKVSMDSRHTQEVRSDYNRDNQYSATHEDALAGGKLGRGTGHGGHTFYLPNCNGTIGIINYSNFDTNPASMAGTDIDNETRNIAMARSLYNYENQYSARIIDSSMNIREGQYVVP